MQLSRMKTWFAGFFLAAALSVPALADANPALPGTLNYVEGNVSIDHEGVTPKSVGSTTMEAGQTITTDNGKAEVLLTPGVFLRLGSDSSAQLVSPSLTNTEVALNHGEAIVEVDELHKQNDIRIRTGDATATLEKTGLYEFDDNPNTVRVFKGEAQVQAGDRRVKVKGDHQLLLASENVQNGKLKATGFDKNNYETADLYRWSSLRSQYLAEANVDAARIYVGNSWAGPGWFWDPYFASYTFIPGAGVLYSPFGWGFYSPAFIYAYGYPGFYGYPYRYRTGPGFYGVPHGYVAHGYAPHPGPRIVAPAPRAGSPVGGFHVMGGGFHGGGFAGHGGIGR
jgi:FecR protein